MKSSDSQKWLRNFGQVSAGNTILVCFPHAGGSASFYRGLANHLSEQLQVLAIQYPGHETRLSEPCIGTMELLVEQISAVLNQLPQDNFSFFGHSMGAFIAYEVAVRLNNTKKVKHLFLSAQCAPHRQRNTPLLQTEEELWQELTRLSSNTSSLLDRSVFKEIFFPALRNDYKLIYDYQNDQPLITSIPITVLLAEDDPEASLDEVMAWQELTSSAFTVKSFKGNHFYITDQLASVAAVITQPLI